MCMCFIITKMKMNSNRKMTAALIRAHAAKSRLLTKTRVLYCGRVFAVVVSSRPLFHGINHLLFAKKTICTFRHYHSSPTKTGKHGLAPHDFTIPTFLPYEIIHLLLTKIPNKQLIKPTWNDVSSFMFKSKDYYFHTRPPDQA